MSENAYQSSDTLGHIGATLALAVWLCGATTGIGYLFGRPPGFLTYLWLSLAAIALWRFFYKLGCASTEGDRQLGIDE